MKIWKPHEISRAEQSDTLNETGIHTINGFVAINEMMLEIDKLRADISNCIPNEFMEKYIARFDVVSEQLSEKQERD